MRTPDKAFQDYYPDEYSLCYGCGRFNTHGLQIKSFWDGDESVCRFQPEPYHLAFPGFVYGGLIASLIDCHATGTSSAAKYRAEKRAPGTDPPPRFVTASLHVDYLAPTPIDATLELRARVKEISDRKAIVSVTLSANGRLCARGEVINVQIPDNMMSNKAAKKNEHE
jgi:acyl-coenzyme A thioesterase PaaI-like protein